MRILICASEYYPSGSGIANVAYNVVKQLETIGVECIVCSPTGPNIKIGSSRLIQKYGIVGLIYFWKEVSKYISNEKDSYDVLWCHNPLFLMKLPCNNVLTTIHTTYHGEFVNKVGSVHIRIYKKIASIIEQHCLLKINSNSEFTVVSPQVSKELGAIGIDITKIQYIPNGVDTKLFKLRDCKKDLRTKFGLTENQYVFLSLGRLTEQKDPIKLIETFAIIGDSIKNALLIIAGRGELLNEARRIVEDNNLKNIVFFGFVDEGDKPDLYACADFYIMTSKYEGQPLTLLEAISSGLPSIVSDIPNLKIVEEGNCGIIVNFSDKIEAAQIILDYVKQDNSNHIINARKYAEENLDWVVITKKYCDEFNEIIISTQNSNFNNGVYL